MVETISKRRRKVTKKRLHVEGRSGGIGRERERRCKVRLRYDPSIELASVKLVGEIKRNGETSLLCRVGEEKQDQLKKVLRTLVVRSLE